MQTIGKRDLIELVIECRQQGLMFSDKIWDIAADIYEGKIELTGTARHALKKFNKYKKMGKIEFCDYIEKTANIWCGQTFGLIR